MEEQKRKQRTDRTESGSTCSKEILAARRWANLSPTSLLFDPSVSPSSFLPPSPAVFSIPPSVLFVTQRINDDNEVKKRGNPLCLSRVGSGGGGVGVGVATFPVPQPVRPTKSPVAFSAYDDKSRFSQIPAHLHHIFCRSQLLTENIHKDVHTHTFTLPSSLHSFVLFFSPHFLLHLPQNSARSCPFVRKRDESRHSNPKRLFFASPPPPPPIYS